MIPYNAAAVQSLKRRFVRWVRTLNSNDSLAVQSLNHFFFLLHIQCVRKLAVSSQTKSARGKFKPIYPTVPIIILLVGIFESKQKTSFYSHLFLEMKYPTVSTWQPCCHGRWSFSTVATTINYQFYQLLKEESAVRLESIATGSSTIHLGNWPNLRLSVINTIFPYTYLWFQAIS